MLHASCLESVIYGILAAGKTLANISATIVVHLDRGLDSNCTMMFVFSSICQVMSMFTTYDHPWGVRMPRGKFARNLLKKMWPCIRNKDTHIFGFIYKIAELLVCAEY